MVGKYVVANLFESLHMRCRNIHLLWWQGIIILHHCYVTAVTSLHDDFAVCRRSNPEVQRFTPSPDSSSCSSFTHDASTPLLLAAEAAYQEEEDSTTVGVQALLELATANPAPQLSEQPVVSVSLPSSAPMTPAATTPVSADQTQSGTSTPRLPLKKVSVLLAYVFIVTVSASSSYQVWMTSNNIEKESAVCTSIKLNFFWFVDLFEGCLTDTSLLFCTVHVYV